MLQEFLHPDLFASDGLRVKRADHVAPYQSRPELLQCLGLVKEVDRAQAAVNFDSHPTSIFRDFKVGLVVSQFLFHLFIRRMIGQGRRGCTESPEHALHVAPDFSLIRGYLLRFPKTDRRPPTHLPPKGVIGEIAQREFWGPERPPAALYAAHGDFGLAFRGK